MISLFSEAGQVLLRNPAAAACFERFDDAPNGITDHLTAMFADSEQGHQLVNKAPRDGWVQAIAVLATEGRPIHGLQLLLIAQQEISETIAARRQLAASEEVLDLILDLHDKAVLVFSPSDGRILQLNSVAERLLGITPSAGGSIGQIFSNPPDVSMITAELLSGRGSNWQIQLLRTGDGPSEHRSSGCGSVFIMSTQSSSWQRT